MEFLQICAGITDNRSCLSKRAFFMHIYCRYVWKVKYLYAVQIWESLSSFIFKTIKLLTDPWKKSITALCLLVNLHHKNWSVGISHSVTYCIQFHSYYCKPISATWVCISAMLSKWRQISSITCYARGTASRGVCPRGEKKGLRPLMRIQCFIIAFGGLEIFCQVISN